MEKLSFDLPVAVASLATPPLAATGSLPATRQVTCLAEAIDFLQEWPHHRRGPIHRAALGACLDARSGRMTVAGARRAFEQFARTYRILQPVPTPPWAASTHPSATPSPAGRLHRH